MFLRLRTALVLALSPERNPEAPRDPLSVLVSDNWQETSQAGVSNPSFEVTLEVVDQGRLQTLAEAFSFEHQAPDSPSSSPVPERNPEASRDPLDFDNWQADSQTLEAGVSDPSFEVSLEVVEGPLAEVFSIEPHAPDTVVSAPHPETEQGEASLTNQPTFSPYDDGL